MWQSRQPRFSLLTLEIFPRWKRGKDKREREDWFVLVVVHLCTLQREDDGGIEVDEIEIE